MFMLLFIVYINLRSWAFSNKQMLIDNNFIYVGKCWIDLHLSFFNFNICRVNSILHMHSFITRWCLPFVMSHRQYLTHIHIYHTLILTLQNVTSTGPIRWRVDALLWMPMGPHFSQNMTCMHNTGYLAWHKFHTGLSLLDKSW